MLTRVMSPQPGGLLAMSSAERDGSGGTATSIVIDMDAWLPAERIRPAPTCTPSSKSIDAPGEPVPPAAEQFVQIRSNRSFRSFRVCMLNDLKMSMKSRNSSSDVCVIAR